MSGRIFTLLLLGLAAAAAAQTMRLEVIPLHSRSAEEVAGVIRPLLAPGGTVTGMNDQLIVKTTPANLEEIRQVLQSIDKPPRRLMISVRQGISETSETRDRSLSGSAGAGDVRVGGRSRGQGEGVTIAGRDADGNAIRYGMNDSDTDRASGNTYQVQTLEGEPALIQSGISVPVPRRETYVTPGGVVVQESTGYYDASSGFYVLPRVSGDTVTVMVAPRTVSAGRGRIPAFDIQNVQTTVSGRLGEWLDIGGLDSAGRDARRSTLSSRETRREEQRSILIKVDEIR